jgi:large subunit ribosomal protein L3
MNFGMYGIKLGNTRVFDSESSFHATVVKVVEMDILGSRVENGKRLVQVSFGKLVKEPNKATVGHFKKFNLRPRKKVLEFVVTDEVAEKLESGKSLSIKMFEGVEVFDVTGTTKGKGFAGVIKRHGFSMQPATHGTSLSHRAHGSTGQNQDPGKVFKGKKMAGHMGNVQRTVQNIKLYKIDIERNLIWLKGAIPGAVNSYVKLSPAIKKSYKLSDNLIQETSKEEAA